MNERTGAHVGFQRSGHEVVLLCLLQAPGQAQCGGQVDEVVVLGMTLVRTARVHHSLEEFDCVLVTLLLHQKLA
jgi:hypothetical protein